MKRSIVFTILLAISLTFKSYSCYFYPYGEDIRFSIFNPENFNYDGFRIYNYTSNYFYKEDYAADINTVTENDLMWYNHCKKSVPITEIKKAIFQIDSNEISPRSKNHFIQYLYQHHDDEAINYLLFAKKAEKYGYNEDDLWENNEKLQYQLREKAIQEAFDRIKKIKNTILKKRYYYQIFKLLSYNNEKQKTIRLFDVYVKLFKTEDFLDDWALYYRMRVEPDNNKMNYLAAQVFNRGTDNRFDVRWFFNRNIPIEKVLKFAKNNDEKANIHVMYSFKRIDQNLDNIKKVYQCDASNRGLNFLLLREINKMEDWILTPTYTMYIPSLREDYWENSNGQRILQRAEIDRKYASKVLDFVNSVDMNLVEDRDFWMTAKSFLEFLTKNYSQSLLTIRSFENQIQDSKIKRQCAIVKAMALTANQDKKNATLLKTTQATILNEYKQSNYSFLFGLAKELEILGDKSDAAFLISQIKAGEYDEYSSFYWKSKSNKITLHDDFYYDWYGYVDAELSASDLQLLVNEIENPKKTTFDFWKVGLLKKESNKINDLMGIKFMREDQLEQAYCWFKKVAKNHYTNAPLFNENPFYKIKGYMNFDTRKTTQNLTKASMVHTLIQLKNKVNQGNYRNKNQDYFLIANCYYNMSYYGNSWMLKRISRTMGRDSNYEDELEYYGCLKAKYYYQKAFESSKSKKFKALSKYMMTKCVAREKEYKYLQQFDNYYYADYVDLERLNNQVFSGFISQYKDDYDEMISNCELFSVYFKAG